MNSPKIIVLDKTFSVTGFYIRTNNENEFNPETAKIIGLWGEFSQSVLPTYIDKNDPHAYGVYSQYASDHEGDYTLITGINSKNISKQSEDYQEVIIQSGHYLVFEADGKQPESIINTWKYIWKYFDDHSAPQRKFTTDFEKYISDSKVEIYIAIVG
jgi:predicted transcriptional regulator YdeE